ncbi:MAG: YbbR domain pair protein [Desulfuromonas sp.]|uniref:CdaR family protein n=1 Tax=Desulfuromonas sp. TaxID=892 RepID=UPI000CB8A4AA|nr:CdaR family protein [Desulfuromonas sp.]PLX83615.1 MAG: YbbR domain pair protein [Desulfuromonas sp.]
MLKLLTENWLLKLLSLVFALVMWFFVMGEQNLEVGYAVQLELQNVPSGMMVSNEVPRLVDVRISGPRTILANLSPADIGISVDLKDLQPGLTSFKRLEERLNIPRALKVTRLSPSFVDVKLERVKEKSVPIRVVLAGAPAEGFQVISVRTEPKSATVLGAESELKDVAEVVTEVVDLAQVRESFTLMVPFNYEGRYTSLKEQKTAEVQVTIESVEPVDPGEQGGKIE